MKTLAPLQFRSWFFVSVIISLGSPIWAHDSPVLMNVVKKVPESEMLDASHYNWKVTISDTPQVIVAALPSGQDASASTDIRATLKRRDTSEDLRSSLDRQLGGDGTTVFTLSHIPEAATDLELDIIGTRGNDSQTISFHITRNHVILLIDGRDVSSPPSKQLGNAVLDRKPRLDRPPLDPSTRTPVTSSFSTDFLNGYVAANGPPAHILVYSLDATLCRDIEKAFGVSGNALPELQTESGQPTEPALHAGIEEATQSTTEETFPPAVVDLTPQGQISIIQPDQKVDTVILYVGAFDADYLANDPSLAGNMAKQDEVLDSRDSHTPSLESEFTKNFANLRISCDGCLTCKRVWAIEPQVLAAPVNPGTTVHTFNSLQAIWLGLGQEIISANDIIRTNEYNLIPTSISPGVSPGTGAGTLLAQALTATQTHLILVPQANGQQGTAFATVAFQFPVSLGAPDNTSPSDMTELLKKDFQYWDDSQKIWKEVADASIDSSNGNTIKLTCAVGAQSIRYLGTTPLNLSLPSFPTRTQSSASSPASSSSPPPPLLVTVPLFQCGLK